jgi:hypothetical protein
MKFLLFTWLLLATAQAAGCERPWIFFDTGETLIAVPKDYKNMQNEPGVEQYLQDLKAGGYPLGLIVNIPEEWGEGIPGKDLVTRRVIYFRQFLAEGWKEGAAPFPMELFGKMKGQGANRKFQGRVFFPVHNSDRKPAICPTCALSVAFAAARRAGCPALYVGEDAAEMAAAESIGFIPFQVGHSDGENFYLGAEKIPEYMKSYTPGRWKSGN